MRRRMAQNLEPFRRVSRDDRNLNVPGDRVVEIDDFTIDFCRYRIFTQFFADAFGDLSWRNWTIEVAFRAVG